MSLIATCVTIRTTLSNLLSYSCLFFCRFRRAIHVCLLSVLSGYLFLILDSTLTGGFRFQGKPQFSRFSFFFSIYFQRSFPVPLSNRPWAFSKKSYVLLLHYRLGLSFLLRRLRITWYSEEWWSLEWFRFTLLVLFIKLYLQLLPIEGEAASTVVKFFSSFCRNRRGICKLRVAKINAMRSQWNKIHLSGAHIEKTLFIVRMSIFFDKGEHVKRITIHCLFNRR